MGYIWLCSWIIQKQIAVIRKQLQFFIVISLHVSVVFDHHRAISTILQDEQMYCVGPDTFTKEITE
jgi:hypothetical protein